MIGILNIFKSNTVQCFGRTGWDTRCKVKLDKSHMHSNDLEHFYCEHHFTMNAHKPGAIAHNPVWGNTCCKNHKW